MSVRFAAKCVLGAVLLMPVHFANAQNLPASVVSSFMANPGQLLTQNPDGGGGLTKQVRDLLTSDKETLASIMTIIKNATPAQQTAMADGLAQAANVQAKTDPAFANQIQAAVAASGLPEVIKQYASLAGDTGTAATGGGGGGGAGGGGPNVAGAPTGGQNSSSPNNTNSFAANSPSNPFTGASVSGSSFSNNLTTFTTNVTNNSVSPNQ
jgi:hypothetical protein